VKGEDPVRIFASLEEAVGAATYALLTGAWIVDPVAGDLDLGS
jgi:hypothetical protein